MIRVEIDVKNIPGALLLTVDELKEAAAFVSILKAAADPLSKHLGEQFSPQAQQLVADHDNSPLSEASLKLLVEELNKRLQDPAFYQKKRFAGVVPTRDTLFTALLKELDPKGDKLVRLNRLLLEEAYPEHIAKSPRAEWDAWNTLAEEETANIIKSWEDWKDDLDNWRKTKVGDEPEFKPAWQAFVWKGIRDWMMEYVFHGKCAYCETPEVGYIADAEHFRPKGRLENNSIKTFDIDGKTEIIHPGYFWLAYRWENLLPSCNTCNRYGGKKEAFPVGKTHVAVRHITDKKELQKLIHQKTQSAKINGVFFLEPEDLDAFEDRLLLHPCFDRPEKHVHFEVDGKAMPRPGSKLGQPSIDVFDLNEKNKKRRRNQIQNVDFALYMTKLTAAVPNLAKMKSVAEEIAREYFKGDRPYGAAVFDYIRFMNGNGVYNPDTLLKDTPFFSKNGSV